VGGSSYAQRSRRRLLVGAWHACAQQEREAGMCSATPLPQKAAMPMATAGVWRHVMPVRSPAATARVQPTRPMLGVKRWPALSGPNPRVRL